MMRSLWTARDPLRLFRQSVPLATAEGVSGSLAARNRFPSWRRSTRINWPVRPARRPAHAAPCPAPRLRPGRAASAQVKPRGLRRVRPDPGSGPRPAARAAGHDAGPGSGEDLFSAERDVPDPSCSAGQKGFEAVLGLVGGPSAAASSGTSKAPYFLVVSTCSQISSSSRRRLRPLASRPAGSAAPETAGTAVRRLGAIRSRSSRGSVALQQGLRSRSSAACGSSACSGQDARAAAVTGSACIGSGCTRLRLPRLRPRL